MLVPAVSRKDELLDKFSQEIYSEKYFWYVGFAHEHELPAIDARNNLYQFAIVNDKSGEAVGFLTYRIDSYADNVYSFGLYSFGDGDIQVGIDVNKELERLVAAHRRLEWCCVGGNKVYKHYEKFCKKHNGRVIEFKQCARDEKGNYHNTYMFEIVKGEINNECNAEHKAQMV